MHSLWVHKRPTSIDNYFKEQFVFLRVDMKLKQSFMPAGIGISKDVISTVVSGAAGSVESVASVGGNDTLAPNLLMSLPAEALLQRRLLKQRTVSSILEFILPFCNILPQNLHLRSEACCATTVNEQIGVSIASVDVYIDSLVFPKE